MPMAWPKKQPGLLLACLLCCSVISAVHGASSVSDQRVQAAAQQLYPSHALLQLSSGNTSSLQAALDAAFTEGSALLVLLTPPPNTAGSRQPWQLLVDRAVSLGPGHSLVLASPPALLRAAAESAAAGTHPRSKPQLRREQLVPVRCHAALDGGFLTARDARSVALLGLSLQACPRTAVRMLGGASLHLQDVELLGHNRQRRAVEGGALLVTDVSRVRLQRVLCSDNSAAMRGGCLKAERVGELLIVDSTISLNQQNQAKLDTEGEGGAGLALEFVQQFVLDRCQVLHNTALGDNGKGGGIQADLCGSVSVRHCTFLNNSASYEGGALNVGDARSVTISDSNFTQNGILPVEDEETGEPQVTRTGGAVDAVGKSSGPTPINITVERCRFEGNRGSDAAGISIYQLGLAPARAIIRDCHFAGNNASWNGGGVYVHPNVGANVTVSNCQFLGNVAGEYGGAMELDDTEAEVEGCTFIDNEAGLQGGALSCVTEFAAGRGYRLTLRNSSFFNNSCGQVGGAIAIELQGLHATDVLVQANSALNGAGGIALISATKVSGSNLELLDNTCDEDAGGLGVQGAERLVLENVTISGNQGIQGGGALLLSIDETRLANVTVLNNSASRFGGGVAAQSCILVTVANSTISGNRAPVGGGLAVDRSHLVLQQTQLVGNVAEQLPDEAKDSDDEQPAGEDDAAADAGSRRRRLLLGQQEEAAGPPAPSLTFASVVHLQGVAGAALVQRSSLMLDGSTFRGNTAAWSAGALLLQQPVRVGMVDTVLEGNSALLGPAGALLLRAPGWAGKLERCSFTNNSAPAGSGGAVMLDSGLGMFEVECRGCRFAGNSAQDGGAVAAAGPASFDCVDCQTSHNSAHLGGGFLSCSGCTRASMQGSNSSNNSAAGAGGAVSCVDCGSLHIVDSSFSSNTASAGGAVASRGTTEVRVTGSSFDANSATEAAAGAAAAAGDGHLLQLDALDRLPAQWQRLYAVVPAGSQGMHCRGGGSGGAVCAAGSDVTDIDSSNLTGNSGLLGGGVFASAACHGQSAPQGAAAGSAPGSSCLISMANVSASGNVAGQGGGALYTSNPAALAVAASEGEKPAWSVADAGLSSSQEQDVLRQLADGNRVLPGGYGPGVASLPSKLSLMEGAGSHSPAAGSAASVSYLAGSARVALAQQPKQLQGRKLLRLALSSGSASRRGRHLLQEASSGASFSDSLVKGFEMRLHQQSAASDASSVAAGVELQQSCPALGAIVLQDEVVAVDANQAFALPVHIQDAFGSQVTAGPGSAWTVQLHHQGGSRSAVQLSGGARGTLSSGQVLLDNLTLAAQPGSEAVMMLTATQGWGSDYEPLSSALTVQVRRCLPGQTATVANSSAGVTTTTCRTCAAPSFSFSAYADSDGGGTSCQSCPACGICVAGMLIPAPGCYMPHPRSASLRACPHASACQPGTAALHNLQALQCRNRWQLLADEIDPRPFTALQCSPGYAGPQCSSCFRLGRNAWVARMLAQQQQVQGQHGFALANQSAALVAPWAGMDAAASFGKASGRCTRCPHIAVAWLGFLAARVVDMAFIALLALLWLALGWLSRSPVQAAYRQLKQQRFAELKFRRTLTLAPSVTMNSRSLRNMRSLQSMRSSRALGGSSISRFEASAAPIRRTSTGAASSTVTGDSDDEYSRLAAAAGGRQPGQQLMMGRSSSQKSSLGETGLTDHSSSAGDEATGLQQQGEQQPSALRAAADADSESGLHQSGQLDGSRSAAGSCSGPETSQDAAAVAAAAAAAAGLSSMRSGSSSRLASRRSGSFRNSFRSSSQRVSFKSQDGASPDDTAAAAGVAAAAPVDDVDSFCSILSPFVTVQSASTRAADDEPSRDQDPLAGQLSTPFGSAAAVPEAVDRNHSIHPQVPSPAVQHKLQAAGPAETSKRSRRRVVRREPSHVGSEGSRSNLSQGSNPDFYQLKRQLSLQFSAAIKLIGNLADAAAGPGKPAAGAKLGGEPVAPVGPAASAAADDLEGEALQVASERAALLMMATRNLACMVQVVLDGAQIAAVLLAQDLMWRVPDWAAFGLSAVLMTQATTWQWVPFDCLLGSDSAASGPVVQTFLVLLLPVLYVVLLFPLMALAVGAALQLSSRMPVSSRASAPGLVSTQQQQWGHSAAHHELAEPSPGFSRRRTASSVLPRIPSEPWLASGSMTSAVSSRPDSMVSPFTTTQQQQQQLWARPAETVMVHSEADPPPAYTGAAAWEPSKGQPDAPDNSSKHSSKQPRGRPSLASWRHQWRQLWRQHATWRMLAALSVAAMAYCYSFYAATVVSVFTCAPLARQASELLPGEVAIPGRSWVPDMQVMCWSRQHAALVAVAFIIGLPLLASYWWCLLVLVWPEPGAESGPGQGESEEQQLAANTAGAGSRGRLVESENGQWPDERVWPREHFAEEVHRSSGSGWQQQAVQARQLSSRAPASLEQEQVMLASPFVGDRSWSATREGTPAESAREPPMPQQRRQWAQQPQVARLLSASDSLPDARPRSRWHGPRPSQQQQQQQHQRQLLDPQPPQQPLQAPKRPARLLPAGASSIGPTSNPTPLMQQLSMVQSRLSTPPSSPGGQPLAGSSFREPATPSLSWRSDAAAAAAGSLAAASSAATGASVADQEAEGGSSTAGDSTRATAAATGTGTDDGSTTAEKASGVTAAAAQWAAAGQAWRPARPQQPGCFTVLFRRLLALVCLPFRWLEGPVRQCQAHTLPVGVTGVAVAGAGVWNMQHRWAWLVVRELLKLAIVLAAVTSTLRAAAQTQAMVLLLVVVLVAWVTWGGQVGCSTSMERLLWVQFLWLQALALLVLVLTLPGVDSSAVGAVLLALLIAMVLQGVFVMGFLGWRCLLAGHELSRHAFERELAAQESLEEEDLDELEGDAMVLGSA